MRIESDFLVGEETCWIKITPETNPEKVVCGAYYACTLLDCNINENGSIEITFKLNQQENNKL